MWNEIKYFFIFVKWKSGFKHIIPIRGAATLRSEMNILKGYSMVDTVKYKPTTEEQYRKRVWG